MRVLITGSRNWTNEALIQSALESLNANPLSTTLVSGACPTGADRMCEEWAARQGWRVERHPADWQKHGKRAGFVRNAEMVDSEIDVAFAFIKNQSRGATMTARLAKKADIETHIFKE